MTNVITKDNILLNIKLKAQRAFKTNKDYKDDWKRMSNKWRVQLSYNNQVFVTDYYMGAGLVDEKGRAKKPKLKDILYSLITDDVTDMNFNEFYDNFGYDNESIKALEIYRDCKKQTEAYYNMFNAEERSILTELLEDY